MIDDRTITEFIFEEIKANAKPNDIALIDSSSDQHMTYGDLVRRVYDLKYFMATAPEGGVETGSVVAVLSANRVEYAELLLALWAVRAKKCFCINEICEPMGASNSSITYNYKPIGENKPVATTQHFSAKDSVALYIFSSGTSGVPKAVRLSHYNIIACIMQHSISDINLPDTSLICQPPFSHIFGVCVILLNNLSLGQKLIIPARGRFDLTTYLSLVHTYQVNMLHLTPPVIVMMLALKDINNYDLSSVRQVLCGSATLTSDLQLRFAAILPPSAVIRQGYGMSETCGTHMGLTSVVVSGSIGKVIPLVDCKIIDISSGNTVDSGKPGELCIKGPQLMMGYHEIDQSPIDSNGWLHTGDLARVDDMGNYFIIDRIKEIIKYNGYQISPAYLESVLLSHPAVTDAAAVGKDDAKCGHLPTAYVVVDGEVTQSLKDSIHCLLADQMSQIYKLRGGLIFIDKIPKLANGKIQRNLLSKMLNRNSKL